MIEELKDSFRKVHRVAELVEHLPETNSNEVYTRLFRNHLDIVKHYVKDGVIDMASINEMEIKLEEDRVTSAPFKFAILYRETGTSLIHISGNKDMGEVIDAVLRVMNNTHMAIVEKRAHYANDKYSYAFYTIKEEGK